MIPATCNLLSQESDNLELLGVSELRNRIKKLTSAALSGSKTGFKKAKSGQKKYLSQARSLRLIHIKIMHKFIKER